MHMNGFEEKQVRSATILELAGAGGVRFELTRIFRLFRYQEYFNARGRSRMIRERLFTETDGQLKGGIFFDSRVT